MGELVERRRSMPVKSEVRDQGRWKEEFQRIEIA
jgi:hypothetical protein